MPHRKPETIKRFLLFGGADYYPAPAWKDFQSAHDNAAAAIAIGRKLIAVKRNGIRECDWAHVVDLHRLDIIWDENADN